MKAVAGNGQTGVVNTTLPTALEAQVLNPKTGQGVSGVTVTFTVAKNGGTLGSPTGVTNTQGEVSTTYTLPEKIGTYTVTASTAGYAPASFAETAVPGPATAMSRISGDNQTTTVGKPLPLPLVAEVHDEYNNGIAGVSVTFSDNGAGGSFSANPVTTNSAGEVTVTYTAGNTPGSIKVFASALSLTKLSWIETIEADPAQSDMRGAVAWLK